jgi:hypothetical protein
VIVTGFVPNVHPVFAGQLFTLKFTVPVNPYSGVTVARSVTEPPAVTGPSELFDMVIVKSGAFRFTMGGVAHLPESTTLHTMIGVVVSLVSELGAV